MIAKVKYSSDGVCKIIHRASIENGDIAIAINYSERHDTYNLTKYRVSELEIPEDESDINYYEKHFDSDNERFTEFMTETF